MNDYCEQAAGRHGDAFVNAPHDGGCGAVGTSRPDGDIDDRAGENPQPHGEHAHDRVLRVKSLHHQARLDGGHERC